MLIEIGPELHVSKGKIRISMLTEIGQNPKVFKDKKKSMCINVGPKFQRLCG